MKSFHRESESDSLEATSDLIAEICAFQRDPVSCSDCEAVSEIHLGALTVKR